MKRVANIGRVTKIRGGDELHTVGFELEASIAAKLAAKLTAAAETGNPVYVWADKRKERVYVTAGD